MTPGRCTERGFHCMEKGPVPPIFHYTREARSKPILRTGVLEVASHADVVWCSTACDWEHAVVQTIFGTRMALPEDLRTRLEGKPARIELDPAVALSWSELQQRDPG
jgi:hypothetical protein